MKYKVEVGVTELPYTRVLEEDDGYECLAIIGEEEGDTSPSVSWPGYITETYIGIDKLRAFAQAVMEYDKLLKKKKKGK